jgi:hypothetical protein
LVVLDGDVAAEGEITTSRVQTVRQQASALVDMQLHSGRCALSAGTALNNMPMPAVEAEPLSVKITPVVSVLVLQWRCSFLGLFGFFGDTLGPRQEKA